jgi:hypothetical protein
MVLRGGSWNNNRDNARCAYRNRNQPDNRNNNIGFRVVLRSPTFFRPSSGPAFPAGRHAGACRPVTFRKCGPIRASGFARRGEGRRTAPATSGPRVRPQGQVEMRGVDRAGRIRKLGHGLVPRPAVPAPLRTCTRWWWVPAHRLAVTRKPSFRGRIAEPGIQKQWPGSSWIPGSALCGLPGNDELIFDLYSPVRLAFRV